MIKEALMKRYIKSEKDVTPSAEDRLNDILSVMKDNFDFALEGIEKIAADGDISGAIQKANQLNDALDGIIVDIAAAIAE